VIGGKNRWGKTWAVRTVTGQVKRDEVDAIIANKPGSNVYMAEYQKALTTVVNGLSEETRAEYRALAQKWNEWGAPRDVQIRLAEVT